MPVSKKREKIKAANEAAKQAKKGFPQVMPRYDELCERLGYEDTAIQILGFDAETMDLSLPAALNDYFNPEELRALRDIIYAEVLRDIDEI